MSYVEIVFAREALLKALVSKERSQIVREMKRAKKLGDNSLDLLLNAAHIFLSLLVKTHKGEKEIKSLQHALLEQEDVSKKRLQEIKEENQIKTRETREELKALKIGYADQASKLTEATRSLQRQCEVKSLTNNHWNKIRSVDLEAGGDPRALARQIVLLEEKYEKDHAEMRSKILKANAARERAEKALRMTQRYSQRHIPDMYATDDFVRSQFENLDAEREKAVLNAHESNRKFKKASSDNRLLKSDINELSEESNRLREENKILKKELNVLLAERRHFQSNISRCVEKERLQGIVELTRLNGKLQAEAEWRKHIGGIDLQNLEKQVDSVLYKQPSSSLHQ